MPAGSLRDDEMRAERCHPLWCSIKSPLARAGERRRGSPLAAPPGMLREQGRAGRHRTASCCWERLPDLGKGGNSTGRPGAVVAVGEGVGRFVPGVPGRAEPSHSAS